MPEDSAARLFVAIDVLGEIRERMLAAQSELRERAPERALSWTNPAQFHLTLKFLGSVRVELVPGLVNALEQACKGFGPFELIAKGVGFFPSASRARVVWAGLEARSDSLQRLHQSIENDLQPFTSEKPENRFHAHITLGRVKEQGPQIRRALTGWAEKFEGIEFGTWKADHVELIRSQLHPSGARYTSVTSFALAP